MTDNQQPENTGTVPGTQPQEQSQAQPQVLTLTQDQLNALMAENRRSKDAEIEQLRGAAQKWKEYEDSQKTEQQKLQDQLGQFKTTAEQAAAELNKLRLQIAVEREAVKLGIVDPEAAFKLVDTSTITVNEQGIPQGVTEAVKALATAKPYLVKVETQPQQEQGQGQQQRKPPFGATNPAGGAQPYTTSVGDGGIGGVGVIRKS